MNLLEPTNHRISNSLFDAINRVRNGILESTVATEGAVDKAHFCATHSHTLYNRAPKVGRAGRRRGARGLRQWWRRGRRKLAASDVAKRRPV